MAYKVLDIMSIVRLALSHGLYEIKDNKLIIDSKEIFLLNESL